jgi:oligopeptide/dipeptide ABC transporter ATP-binding protein
LSVTETTSGEAAAVLRAVDVSAGYGGGRHGTNVLHGVDLAVAPGRTVGVVGESGSGKSTLARVLVGQLRPAQGQVLLDGADVGTLHGEELRAVRRRIQLIPQDPYASLDPRMSIRRALEEAIDPRGRRRSGSRDKVAALLYTVALDPDVADRRPHEFSGGQRQRIAIARALAVEPEVIIADEVTSSLDSSVQAEILNLLRSIQEQTDVAMVFITHDLSVANYVCDEICVLYLGRVVEKGTRRLLFSPDHPYTRLLVESISRPGAPSDASHAAALVVDDAADPTRPPSGCPFHPRCPEGPRRHEDRQACVTDRPSLVPRLAEGRSAQSRWTACHFPLRRDTGSESLESMSPGGAPPP